MAARSKPYFDYSIEIGGEPVRLRLRRMTLDEFEDFNSFYQAISNGRGAPKWSADEVETLDVAKTRLEAESAFKKEHANWVYATFEENVTIVEGDLIHERTDGSEEIVTSGRRFVELYRLESASVLNELWVQNALTDAQKKRLLSPSGSGTGSTIASRPEAPGPRPATTATSAEPEGSVLAVDATESSSDESSGTTDRSAFAPVLSVN